MQNLVNFFSFRNSIVVFCVLFFLIYAIPEIIFYLKHVGNDRGLKPEECLERYEATTVELVNEKANIRIAVNFISNSPRSCLCPGFPVIKLVASEPINAWIQVIETDSEDESLSWFVDGLSADSLFYTRTKVLSDSPRWGGLGFYYSFVTRFQARAYPVFVDRDERITIYAPVEWGFYWERFKILLPAFSPKFGVSKDTMENDLARIKRKFPTFEFIKRFDE